MSTLLLPKLNNLTPTLESTLLKVVEETGELSRAILKFLPYEQHFGASEQANQQLTAVAEELLDVAQTCVTMIFVMEEKLQININSLICSHLLKLKAKGYDYDDTKGYTVTNVANFKYLDLPRLVIPQVNLLTTVCKIQEELGELTQFLGKYSGASGEKQLLGTNEVINGCALELLDVAQCCFTMIYILEEKYLVNINQLIANHIAKLKRKGYYK